MSEAPHVPTLLKLVPTPLEGKNAELAAEVRALVYGELNGFLSDVEFRLAQTQELSNRMIDALRMFGGNEAVNQVMSGGRVYAEDIVDFTHRLTGYTVSASSGTVTWASLTVVYAGTSYPITNGSSTNKYIWFDQAVSASALQSSNTKPTLTGNAVLLFINNGGSSVTDVLLSSIPPVVANNAIDSGAIQANAVGTAAIANNAVTAAKTDFYTSLAAAVTAAQDAATLAQATADGAINTYFQANRPWADGTTQPAAVVGDIWYEQGTGKAYRWGGAAATPANTWIEIVDTQAVAALTAANNAQASANIKTATYYSNNATPPTAPVPPAGNGFTTGDFWVVTDQGNLVRRWSGSAWVDLQVGTGAIANSAVTDAKVASGIAGTKLSAGTVGNTQLGSGAVSPAKLNVFQHMIF